MKVTLKQHEEDSVMIVATAKYGDETRVLFVTHDENFGMPDDHDIYDALQEDGEAVVEMTLAGE